MAWDDPPELDFFPREEFLAERWDYKRGGHVTILAPTQNGKTTLAFQLLDNLPPLKHPPVMLVMKPRDPVVTGGIKQYGYKRIRAWPPPPSIWHPRPPAYALWPRHSFDPDRDDAVMYREFRKAILGRYKQGDSVILADETYGLVEELRLGREITAVHTRGSGMGLGVWCMSQKPGFIGTWAYSQADHLFLGYDPDKRARDRFAEIGGVDPDIVKWHVARLPQYHWLYIRRTGRKLCLVGP